MAQKIERSIVKEIVEKFVDENYPNEIIFKDDGKIRFLLIDENLKKEYDKNKNKVIEKINNEFDQKLLEFYTKYVKKIYGESVKDVDLFTLMTLHIDDQNSKYLILEIIY